MGPNLSVAIWGFPPRHPLRLRTLLQCGIAILSLAVRLVPLRALASGAGATPDEGDEAYVYAEEDEAKGTDWRERTRTEEPGESISAEMDFSSVQDERDLLVESLAGGATPGRSATKNRCILLATLIGVMLAILGAAAQHSGAFAGLKQKLVTLVPEATDPVGPVAFDESSASRKLFEDGTASAKQEDAEAVASTAAKEASRQQQQDDVGLNPTDSISSLRLLSKLAQDKAQIMTNEAKAVAQRSASRTQVGEAHIAVLNDEFTQAYLITKKALETTIAAFARDAEEALEILQKLPPLRREDDGHLVGQATGYMKLIEIQAGICGFADELMLKYDTLPVAAHRRYYRNKQLKTQLKIEKLHASMNAHKAIALQALSQKNSTVSSDIFYSLKDFVKAVDELEKQFEKVSESFSLLTRPESTANTVEASVNMTAEAAKFMDLHDVCLVKLKQTQHFLDSGKVPCLEGSKVVKAAVELALLQGQGEYNRLLAMLKFMRERKQSVLYGTVGGFQRPLVNPEIIQRATSEMDALEDSFNDAMDEIQTTVDGTVRRSFKDDLEALERVHKARVNMAGLSKRADESIAFFKMLTALVLDVESSVGVYETVEQARKSEAKEPLSGKIDALFKQLRAEVVAAKEAATLPDLAQAASALRGLADQLLISFYGQKQDR
ncbi:hypothetical protein Emag_002348 [Eimeria magna]